MKTSDSVENDQKLFLKKSWRPWTLNIGMQRIIHILKMFPTEMSVLKIYPQMSFLGVFLV